MTGDRAGITNTGGMVGFKWRLWWWIACETREEILTKGAERIRAMVKSLQKVRCVSEERMRH